MNDPSMTYDRAKRACGNVAAITTWLHAIVGWHSAMLALEPRQLAADAAKARIRDAEAIKAVCDNEVTLVQAKADHLTAAFESAVKEKSQLRSNIDVTQSRLKSAAQLIDGFDSERGAFIFEGFNLNFVVIIYIDIAFIPDKSLIDTPSNSEVAKTIRCNGW